MQPLIVNLAPTGMVPTRRDSPHVPLSVAGIAADCRIIFHLPHQSLENFTPWPSSTARMLVTSSSRPTISTAIHG